MQTETASSNEEKYQVRKLEITDKNKGFMELLQQLTVCDPVSDEVFQNRFEELKSYGDDHIICVIEDVCRSKIVATGSVFIEKKFVRSCGKAGHIEDVVVDSSARGMQLGKKVIGFLADHARSMGCYKLLSSKLLTYSRLLIIALLQRMEVRRFLPSLLISYFKPRSGGDPNSVQDDMKSEEEAEIVYDESANLLSGKNGGNHS
ncbi:glucosamine 6-phosphate N-acetyltransferase [Tanacetum coccineum]